MSPHLARRPVLAFAAVLAAGCGGDRFEDHCPAYNGLPELHQELGTDYLAQRRYVPGEDVGPAKDEPDPEPGLEDWGAQGTPCATASDPEACAAALEAALPDEPWWPCDGVRNGLVATRGDTVTLADEVDEVVAFFGSVDSAAKVLFLVLGPLDFGDVECDTVEEVSAGWEVVATVREGCCDRELPIQRIRIAPDGAVTVVEQVGVDEGSGDCP